MPYTDQTLVSHLRNNLNGSESIIYYIHDESSIGVDIGNGQGNTLTHISFEEQFIEDTFNSIDSIIDLDFTRSYSPVGSDIDIYSLSGHSDWSDNIMGMAWLMGYGEYSWFDIGWKYTQDWNADKNTIIHEIGHALGLGEPGFDPQFNSSDTVMSYNPNALGSFSTSWSYLDLSALISQWGLEDDVHAYDYRFFGGEGDEIFIAKSGADFGNDLMIGEAGNDSLTGFRGADQLAGGAGNDLLRAGNGRDIIAGGAGEDKMYGGFGLNTFENADDGEIDQLFFKSDQHAYNWIYGKDGNSPNGEKADKIMKLDLFDEIYVQGVETEELDFGNVLHHSDLGETLDGIGIYASGTLEAVYVGNDLHLWQIEAMTQGIL